MISHSATILVQAMILYSTSIHSVLRPAKQFQKSYQMTNFAHHVSAKLVKRPFCVTIRPSIAKSALMIASAIQQRNLSVMLIKNVWDALQITNALSDSQIGYIAI